MVSVTGCSGCRDAFTKKQKTEEEKRKEEEELEKEKPKDDFEPMQSSILPGSNPVEEDSETFDGTEMTEEEKTKIEKENPNIARSRQPVTAKPGHWVHVRYRAKANNFDFNGELSAECVDRNLLSMDLQKSPYSVTSIRPASLPKEQSKDLEVPIFISVPAGKNRRTVQVLSRLRNRSSGREVIGDITPTTRLKPHQYHLVVLAKNPDSYGFLRAAETIKPPYDEWAMDGLQENYVVTLHEPEEGRLLPLPNNALAWTSIAYIIWDDLLPDTLDEDQQAAMLDWIHWGGQLLVSGPRSLDSMRSSFLADYLPAKTGKARAITDDEFDEVNEKWSLMPKGGLDFDPDQYRLGGKKEGSEIEITPLEPVAPAEPVEGTAGMVVERRVGRGRILATAFPMSERRFVNWQNYDGFLNGCLMRLPARTFYKDSSGFGAVKWADRDLRLHSQDARLATDLRFFSRDMVAAGETGRRTAPRQTASGRGFANRAQANQEQVELDAEARRKANELAKDTRTAEGQALSKLWGFTGKPRIVKASNRLDGTRTDAFSGVGGWSDFTAAASSVRRSLKDAAGIEIPNSDFVAKILLGYLICLVPVNWLIFRVIRKVEWAWFAAPLIAIAGAVGVVKMAQLDIGFVRSRTEVAILEMHAGYDRAHLTRYCGVYSSLTSNYAVTFEDDQAFALPFSTDPRPDQLEQMRRRRQQVAYRRDKRVGLSGYPVLSNSTGMLHIEQMIDVAGRFELKASADGEDDGASLTNSSAWDLKSAMVVRCDDDGRLQVALIGDMPIGEEAKLEFADVRYGQDIFEFLARDVTTAQSVGKGIVSVHELYRLGLNPAQFAPGDTRLLGWTDQEMEGMEIEPAATQKTFRTLIVEHLQYRDFAKPQVDTNHFAQYRKDPNEDEEIDIE